MRVLQMKQKNNKQEKICHSIKGAVGCTDFSRSYYFEAIKNGTIKSFKRGSRRFILHKDLVEHINQVANDAGVE